jgi:hydrogenase maturation protease
MTREILIVGIGSSHGDDRAGWRVAELLAERLDQDNIDVRQAASPVQLLSWLAGVRQLIICDACRGLDAPGRVHRWNWPSKELSDVAWSGTHDLSLPAVLALAERLGHLPRVVIVWAIEGSPGGPVEPMSRDVAAVLPQLVAEISRDVAGPKFRLSNKSQ